MKNAFTMIELVFVIVVLGILSAVAIPRLSGSVEDANIATCISTISTIRSAIASERQRSLILGTRNYPAILDDATTAVGEALFDGNASINILQYGVYAGNESGDWIKTSVNDDDKITYKYYLGRGKDVTFTYKKADGTFDCDHVNNEYCRRLTE
jgi:general secretion pathway protein G